ncbi:SDR family oxidoreductase [Mycobacterium colombiense]|uniref:Short-chain dehydrogenase/reductase n=1 Tax=Mycobacterium colombiense CECT 3035 TaxID=1041522 RepID=J4SI25_9MYCO|nr:SDR family oxidoreductase [Mycobacterium colombiense]EJO89470.1 short-chain dehydrogenase/reductase [Mycobacterium colombiense CECT 3035]
MATDNRIAVVTGANKGIGRAIVEQLAVAGVTVFLGSRDRARGQAAVDELTSSGLDVRLLELDITDDASVAAAVKSFTEQADRLDALVNNAGAAFGWSTAPSAEPLDQIKAIYDVNVFGTIRVTQAFIPLLKVAPSANVVMMSSLAGSLTAGSDRTSPFYRVNQLGYNSSKTALNGVVVAFAKELSASGVKVNAVEPGFVGTEMNAGRGPLTPAQGAVEAVRLALAGTDGPSGGFFGADGSHPW